VREVNSIVTPQRSARTLLEQLIRSRRQTFEEFVDYAAGFARDHNEIGTLSLRHLQRLAAGGTSSTQLRPATARLLERIFGEDVELLLSSPDDEPHVYERGRNPSNARRPHSLRVAVAAVIKQEEILIVSRRDGLTASIGTWQFPAGMVKPGADSRHIASAETLAETGIHSIHVRKLGERLHPATSVYCDYHLCEYVSGQAANLDPSENSAVSWIHLSLLSRLIPDNVIFPPLLAVIRSGA
jgi:8-oxo-dGTP pyrophosphatase MutT (NUDIX family)